MCSIFNKERTNRGTVNQEEEKLQIKTPKLVIKQTGETISLRKLQSIIDIYKERLRRLSEISELIDFFFQKELNYKKELLAWKDQSAGEILSSLDKCEKTLSDLEKRNWTKQSLEKILLPIANQIGESLNKKGDRGYLLWPLRIALSGKKASAGPFEIAEILGKEDVLKRIEQAKEKIK